MLVFLYVLLTLLLCFHDCYRCYGCCCYSFVILCSICFCLVLSLFTFLVSFVFSILCTFLLLLCQILLLIMLTISLNPLWPILIFLFQCSYPQINLSLFSLVHHSISIDSCHLLLLTMHTGLFYQHFSPFQEFYLLKLGSFSIFLLLLASKNFQE